MANERFTPRLWRWRFRRQKRSAAENCVRRPSEEADKDRICRQNLKGIFREIGEVLPDKILLATATYVQFAVPAFPADR
jgi:hypothetical protein